MAITKDTAALVAAQLTVAWAVRSGKGPEDPANPHDAQVLAKYLRFKGLVAEVDIRDIAKLPG